MFSSLGLFREVECPELQQCSLPGCLFAHSKPLNNKKRNISAIRSLGSTEESKTLSDEDEDSNTAQRPRKKSRVDNHESEDVRTIDPTVKVQGDILKTPPVRGGAFFGVSQVRNESTAKAAEISSREGYQKPPPSMEANNHRLTSPRKPEVAIVPTKTPTPKIEHAQASQTSIKETLNPRMLPHPPASHSIRYKLLTLLHESMTKLNEKVKHSTDPSISSLTLSTDELIQKALSDEERMATQNVPVYTNTVKQRIFTLRNMTTNEWIAQNEIRKQIRQRAAARILISPEEVEYLLRLRAKPEVLTDYEYVLTAPTEGELEQSRKGVETAQGWENCARCQTRFQVFPGRRANDGALTTGGRCVHHFGKILRHTNSYTCCSQVVGASTGCVADDTHVFKISDAKRLALAMQFMETPANKSPRCKHALNLDCEMSYTTLGLEMVRMTATAWPSGRKIIDVLVRPLGEILDFNTRFSGVTAQDFMVAEPFNHKASATPPNVADSDDDVPKPLKIVGSPSEARELLFAHITPSTPLVGHALNNDLNVLRIIHTSVVDTAILYPHHEGPPKRNGLKVLAATMLGREIQMSTDKGHDSKEDANAAGDLVRFKIEKELKLMKRNGWKFVDGKFVPPPASKSKGK